MNRRLLYTALVFFSVLLPASSALGDALVITRAMLASTIVEVFIEEDSIRVELEIGPVDLAGFRNIMPDEIYERMGYEPEAFSVRSKRFFNEDLIIRPEGGGPLPGEVTGVLIRKRIQRDQITGEPLPADDEKGELIVFVELVYRMSGHPPVLVFIPPRSESGYASANIGFQVYHKGLHINDFRYFGSEEVLRLDWDDPWYTSFDNRNLRRQYFAPISVFLYVENYEVRKEIVLRPKDLQQWTDLGLEGKEMITVAEQEEIIRKAAQFLAEHTPVTIDGKPVAGAFDRAHFIYRTLRTSGVIIPARDLETISATLGVIFTYPIEGLPQEVTMDWQLFGERITSIPATATDEAGGLPSLLAAEDPVLKWQNFLKSPTIPGLVDIDEPPSRSAWTILLAIFGGAACVILAFWYGGRAAQGEKPPIWIWPAAAVSIILIVLGVQRGVIGPALPEKEVGVVVGGLLENIYRAFDYREEGVIYDVLARSATGDVLTDIYLQTRRSLELKNQGGARAKVKEVEMLAAESVPLDGELGFEARCEWKISGSVLHWGHIHSRANRYAARFVVKAIDGVWKITDLELLDEIRIDPMAPPSATGTSSGT